MNAKHTPKAVTWQAFGGTGARINICLECEAELKIAKRWPRHPSHGEYGQVYQGLHEDRCDLCDGAGNCAPDSILPGMLAVQNAQIGRCPNDGAEMRRGGVMSGGAMVDGIICTECGAEWTWNAWDNQEKGGAA